MNLADFLNALNTSGIRFAAVDGQLELRGARGSLTPEILAGASEHKAAILAVLSAPSPRPSASSSCAPPPSPGAPAPPAPPPCAASPSPAVTISGQVYPYCPR